MKRNVLCFIILLILLCPVMSGCYKTSVVSSNPRQVIVESAWADAKEAQRLADAECAKHKCHAKMTIKADWYDINYVFECVE